MEGELIEIAQQLDGEFSATQLGHPIELVQVARCLDKAGLINWKGVS